MSDQHQALAGAAQVEQAADSLSRAADALHARIVDGLPKAGAAPPGAAAGWLLGREEAQALFEQEVALRQHAQQLYLDAAVHVMQGLAASQQSLLGLAEAARKKIARIDKVQDLATLAADLLAVAGAIAGAKPEHLAEALDDLRDHIKEYRQHPGPA